MSECISGTIGTTALVATLSSGTTTSSVAGLASSAVQTLVFAPILIGTGAVMAAGAAAYGAYKLFEGFDRHMVTVCRKYAGDNIRELQNTCMTPRSICKRANQKFDEIKSIFQIPKDDNSGKLKELRVAMALDASGLSQFVSPKEFENMRNQNFSDTSFQKAIKQATDRFKTKQYNSVIKSINDVVKELGFTELNIHTSNTGKKIMSYKNENGKSVLVHARSTDNGPKLMIDVPGSHEDRKCMKIQEEIYKRLEKRGIKFLNLKRKLHYKKEGIIHKLLETGQAKYTDNEVNFNESTDDFNRRQINLNTNTNKI